MQEVRLIDAIELVRYLCGACPSNQNGECIDKMCWKYDYRARIENAPTIEPEVRHGRWIVHTTWHGMFGLIHSECSACKFDRNGDLSSWNFCPNCGARMGATDTNVGGKGGVDNG